MDIRIYEKPNDALTKLSEIFEHFYEAITFAACVAFEKKLSFEPNSEKAKRNVPLDYFNSLQGFHGIFLGVHFAKLQDESALIDDPSTQKKRVEDFENLANAGLVYLNDHVIKRQGNLLDNLLSFINNEGHGFNSGNNEQKKPFNFMFDKG